MMFFAPWAFIKHRWRTVGRRASLEGGAKAGTHDRLRALLAMAPLVGGGESIHAIFQKEKTVA